MSILSMLPKSPNIVRFYGSHAAGDMMYLVMEHCGMKLANALESAVDVNETMLKAVFKDGSRGDVLNTCSRDRMPHQRSCSCHAMIYQSVQISQELGGYQQDKVGGLGEPCLRLRVALAMCHSGHLCPGPRLLA